MQFKSDQLDNGLTVMTDHVPDSSISAIHWALRSGSRHEAFPGTAHFFEHILAFAPSLQPGLNVTERFHTIAPGHNFSTAKDSITGFAFCLPQFTGEVVASFGRCAADITSDEGTFAREKQRILLEYLAGQDNESKIIDSALMHSAFGDHPVTRSGLGTEDSIRNMQPSHLSDYMRDHFHAQRMGLVVSGPAQHEEIMEMAQKAFGGLPKGGPTPAQDVPAFQGDQFIGIPRKDSRQTKVQLDFPADADSVPSFIMMKVYASTLATQLQRTGLVYYQPSASYYSNGIDTGEINISIVTSPENAGKATEAAYLLAARPEEWLTQEKVDEVQLLRKTESMRSFRDSTQRASTIAHRFGTSGRAYSYEDVVARARAIGTPQVRAGYDKWNRECFNVLAFGHRANVPAPDELKKAAAQAKRGPSL
jgi:predicted Zn-dependent peptidase